MDKQIMEGKRVSESFTQQVQIVQSEHINGYQRLFGGQLMAWMDIVAGVTARRHCCRHITTAAVEGLQFLAPAFLDDMLIITGRITYIGKTSLEVKVDVQVEALNNSRRKVNEAYFIMVALDENNAPCPAPPLILETDEDRELWQSGKLRKEQRSKRT